MRKLTHCLQDRIKACKLILLSKLSKLNQERTIPMQTMRTMQMVEMDGQFTTTGAIVGYGAVTLGFLAVGLSPAGPIAGGWFAANMGAGLVAGSWMATLQSAAMTATAYHAGGAVGAVGGAIADHKL